MVILMRNPLLSRVRPAHKFLYRERIPVRKESGVLDQFYRIRDGLELHSETLAVA